MVQQAALEGDHSRGRISVSVHFGARSLSLLLSFGECSQGLPPLQQSQWGCGSTFHGGLEDTPTRNLSPASLTENPMVGILEGLRGGRRGALDPVPVESATNPLGPPLPVLSPPCVSAPPSVKPTCVSCSGHWTKPHAHLSLRFHNQGG